ncbi:hypothetical protein IVB15_19495 [Bradyrhizobium sp. 182]|uniref:hypothetical protein n=1 Tax=Bradyrhizobium sp. 182 TaxID=2782651 RepID=UPI001FFA803B|nr:hypothetical protein [Bradyrhizobium sp. 182]MCK1529844.1 hypothetical protein [Bradyrhizobium sp. 182]
MSSKRFRLFDELSVGAEKAISVDVDATTAIRTTEALTAKRMIERSLEQFGLYRERSLVTAAMARIILIPVTCP